MTEALLNFPGGGWSDRSEACLHLTLFPQRAGDFTQLRSPPRDR
ncbi:MAG: hypothetical protein WBB29_08465 [Geitlerinemataceae cyanobacterium]